MWPENKGVIILNCWKDLHNHNVFISVSSLFSMATCRYWQFYIHSPNCKNHHSFNSGLLLIYSGGVGFGMSCHCLSIDNSLVVDHLHPFWQLTCDGARPKVCWCVPTPPKLFFISSLFTIIIVSLQWWCWSREGVFLHPTPTNLISTPPAAAGHITVMTMALIQWCIQDTYGCEADPTADIFLQIRCLCRVATVTSLAMDSLCCSLFDYVLKHLPMAGYEHVTTTVLIQRRNQVASLLR